MSERMEEIRRENARGRDFGEFEHAYTNADHSLKRGTIYLLHFERKVAGERHYLGWTTTLSSRLRAHLSGEGARLTFWARKLGIRFVVAKTWPNRTVKDEAWLQRPGLDLRTVCPLCTDWAAGKQDEVRERIATSLRELRRL